MRNILFLIIVAAILFTLPSGKDFSPAFDGVDRAEIVSRWNEKEADL